MYGNTVSNLNEYDYFSARKQFSNVGFACFMLIVLQNFIAVITAYILNFMGIDITTSSMGWLISFLPNYIIAFPICILIINSRPHVQIEKRNLPASKYFMFFIIAMGLLLFGSITSSILSSVLSGVFGIETQNPIEDLAMSDEIIVKTAIMSVIAPIFEEYFFRKKIIDSLYAYGEKRAIVISGFIFGLIHANLYQFFYAFALGLLFGYIYVKTGKIIYSITYHLIINFMGSTVVPLLINLMSKDIDINNLGENISEEELIQMMQNPAFLAYILYIVFMIITFVASIVLIAVNKKNIRFSNTILQIPRNDEAYKISMINTGMILFVVLCAVFIGLSLVSM